MIRPPKVASSTKFLMALSVLLTVSAATTITFVDATATLAKPSYASKLPETQHQGSSSSSSSTHQYVVSSFSNCSSSSSIGNEEKEPVAAATAALAAQKKSPTTPALKAAYQWYLKSCVEKPFRTKGLTSATIAALGDVIAQQIEKKATAKAFSLSRVATFFFCNMLFTGPFIHMWYTFLNDVGQQMDKRFGNNISNLKKTVAQVFLDQTLGTAIFFPLYIYAYNVFESIIQMHRLPSLSHGTEKCQQHLWGIIMTQFRVYPFSNMINFGLIPYELRVLFTSTVSLFWNIYLCGVVG